MTDDHLVRPDGTLDRIPYEKPEALVELLIEHVPKEQLLVLIRTLNAHIS